MYLLVVPVRRATFHLQRREHCWCLGAQGLGEMHNWQGGGVVQSTGSKVHSSGRMAAECPSLGTVGSERGSLGPGVPADFPRKSRASTASPVGGQ